MLSANTASSENRLQAGAPSAPERPGDPCLGISGSPCHKGTSRSYTQRRQRRSGKLMVWDVTVVSTTAESYVAAATRGRGEVAEMAGTRKCQKYSELSTAYLFLPIDVETLSPMNDSAI